MKTFKKMMVITISLLICAGCSLNINNIPTDHTSLIYFQDSYEKCRERFRTLSKDVEKRFEIHKNGRGARYTRIHEPEKLVYVEQFEHRSEAMRRELKIKKLSHNKKLQLIIENNKSKIIKQK